MRTQHSLIAFVVLRELTLITGTKFVIDGGRILTA